MRSRRFPYAIVLSLVASACGGNDGLIFLSDARPAADASRTVDSRPPADAPPSQADGAVAQPDASPSQPDGAVAQADAAQSQPDAAVAQPDAAVAQPDAAVAQPDAAEAQPDAAEAQPDAAEAQPDAAEPDAAGPDAAEPPDAGPPDAMPTPPTGALVTVSMSTRVGVLLEDFPMASRTRIADALIAAPDDFWVERAKQQILLTTLRLVYRELYYTDLKDSLPLTPDTEWQITLDPGGPKRGKVDSHDVVFIDYDFATTILTDANSPAISEPALGTIGGVWDESFVFPVDPTLLLQRTGYACMDEDEFPPESVDAENAWEFYDDQCTEEAPGEQSCHLTLPLPMDDCVAAVRMTIGRAMGTLHFERVPFNGALADQVRTTDVRVGTPDLKVMTGRPLGLENHRVIYKYFPPDHCAVVENCVSGTGWRRLIVFDSYDQNIGSEPIHIGEVDYFVAGLGGELIQHHVYELSECHNHYHFEYYGDFAFGDNVDDVHKNGFCLESTGRISNNEWSPTHTPYDCELQGVSAGWGDLYAAGLTCNWLDVTNVDTTAGPVVRDLTFFSNPDGFICEGELEKDPNGAQLWEPTAFVSDNNEPVDRPACLEAPGTDENDIGKVPATLPQHGGALRLPCPDGQNLGPLRNCGFAVQATPLSCTAGQSATVRCTGGSAAAPQVARLCETSRALGEGVDCGFNESLGNVVVQGAAVNVTVVCPSGRDLVEIGGQIAVYTAPVYAPDGASAVTCTVLP